jgi:hypothetical protein
MFPSIGSGVGPENQREVNYCPFNFKLLKIDFTGWSIFQSSGIRKKKDQKK